MHMALAQRLIADVPDAAHDVLQEAWGAFLLGSVAPDARVSSGISRADTHFFDYKPVIDPPPEAVMLARHPALRREAIQNTDKAAFVAGYNAHLAMDVVWCTDLLFPCFIYADDWAPPAARHLALHVLLGYLDDRDRRKLPDSDYWQLSSAAPDDWLPFMSDSVLAAWRDLIASQLAPGATSQTFDILGKRIGMAATELSTLVSDQMPTLVWTNVSPARVAEVEEAMYTATRSAVLAYLNGSP